MNISKIVIYNDTKIIHTLAYYNETLIYHLQNKHADLTIDTVIHGVISKSNHINKNAFINLKDQSVGFINLSQPLENQTKIKAQLVWHGNDEKLAKYKDKVNFSGKYLVLFANGQGRITYSKKLAVKPNFEFIIPTKADLTIRSSVAKLTSLDVIAQEYEILLAKYNEYMTLEYNSHILGSKYYIMLMKELDISKCTSIITNDSMIYSELMNLQNMWQLPLISKDIELHIDINSLLTNTKELVTKHNAKIHLHQVAGINLIDIDSYGAKCSKEKLCYLVIDEIINMIKVNNLSGIILIDMLKDISKDTQDQIISKFKQVLSNDITTNNVLGFSHTGLLEIIRHKF